MIYAISYDLNRPGQDYSGLYQAIMECGSWWHYLDSTWLVHSSMNATQIWNHIASKVDASDRILVIGVTSDYQGWLTKDAWDWINARINLPAPPMNTFTPFLPQR
jgi:hypothetical protein